MSETENLIKERDTDGSLVVRKEVNHEKIINDQTIHVANIFSDWKKQQGIEW